MKQKLQKVSPADKSIYLCVILLMTLTVGAYTAYLMGSTFFLLPFEVSKNSPVIDFLVSMILFAINLYLWIGASLPIEHGKILVATIVFLPIWFFLCWRFQNNIEIATMYAPFLYIVILAIINKEKWKNFKSCILYIFILALIINGYSILAAKIKFNMPVFVFAGNVPMFSKVFYQLDFIAVLFLPYLKGGNRCYELGLENLLAGAGCTIKYSKGDMRAIEEYSQYVLKDRIRLALAMVAVQLLQLFLITSLCMLGNVLWEFIIICISMILFRTFILKSSWHSNTMFGCTIVSAAIFFTASKVSVPFNLSMFAPVLIGVTIAICMFRLGLYTENAKKDREFREGIEKFNIKTCTKEQILERCRLCGIKEEREMEFCIHAFIENYSIKELANFYPCAFQTANNKKSLYRNMLNNFKPG